LRAGDHVPLGHRVLTGGVVVPTEEELRRREAIQRDLDRAGRW
jgi:hypothetical protein